MKKLLTVIVAAGFVTACGQSEASPQDTVGNIYAAAQIAVSARLRDPSSAVWHGADFAFVAEGIAICGRVSGRNGFGGYGDSLPYVAYVRPGKDGGAMRTEVAVSGDTGFSKLHHTACAHAIPEVEFLKQWQNTADKKTKSADAKPSNSREPMLRGSESGARAKPSGAMDAWSICSQHWLGSTSHEAYDAASADVRAHVIDCTTLYDGKLPNDKDVIAYGKKQDAAENADAKAFSDFLTCKLKRKPNTTDYMNAVKEAAADNIYKRNQHGWKGIEHYSAAYLASLKRCAERVAP